MKTKKQITDFVSVNNYKTSSEYDAIKYYLRGKYGIKTKLQCCICEDGLDMCHLIDWINNGICKGDIIRDADNIYIAGNVYVENVHIVAQIKDSGITMLPSETFIPISRISKIVKHVDLEKYKEIILAAGYSFDKDSNLIANSYKPKYGELIKFYNENTSGYGAFDRIDDGDLIMHCYFLEPDDDIRYMSSSSVGSVYDFTIEQMTVGYRRKLERLLNAKGKSYNVSQRRVEPKNMKAEIGKPYYYITDKFTIMKGIENGNATAHRRYLVGNYWKTMDEACEYLSRITGISREMLSR